MNLNELENTNRATVEAIERSHASGGQIPLPDTPYYGYVNVDLFECPPFVMFTNNDAPIVKYVLYHREFEPMSMLIWCRLCKSATGIVDIGANIGVYSLAAAGLRHDLKIYAFEPNPYAFTRLRMHKELNQLQNIALNPYAVGESNGYIKMGWQSRPGGWIASGASLNPMEGSGIERINVEMIKLDGTNLASALGTKPLIKIDVEGAEYAVIKGMSEILALRPDIILETLGEAPAAALNERLLPMGYSVYRVEEQSRTLSPQERIASRYNAENKTIGDGFNYFLTTRTREDVLTALNMG